MTSQALWTADTAIDLLDCSIGDLLAEQARATPTRPAILWEDGHDLRQLTWMDLHQAAARGARWLLARTRPGARIAVWAPNSVGWVVLEYASALAGTVLTPLNPALVDAECEYLLRAAGTTLLFTVAGSAGRPLLTRADQLRDSLPAIRAVVDLEAWAAKILATTDTGAAPPPVQPRAPFLVQFTSGTTGQPKGALLDHLGALNSARFSALAIDPTDGEVWCTALPLHHVGGSVSTVLGALAVRGAYVVAPTAEPGALLRLLARSRATHTGFVPTVLQRLVAHPDFANTDLSALRTMMGGGASLPPALVRDLEARLDATVLIGYGQSESVSITQTSPHDSAEDKATTIGRPLPRREVRIRRIDTATADDSGDIAAFDEVGELCTRSPLTMTGYLAGPEGDIEVLDADGWLHTGDLASMDARGVLTYRGRLREMIIRGGENIYPREIEEALLTHPEIAEAAVVGVPDPLWGEQVAAFVRPAPGAALTEDELRAHARQVLAPFKVPVVWRQTTSFPMTASQKIRKNILRDELDAELAQQRPAG
ncbi:class I adenylate-forming enzyme family protein [Pseudofrankia sp. BMG5.36]|uniref:class I adenylate-forming enzyme family protein n=1 Tax=Pseudofrankia sp. BMG5.36 TaxID=1834512 RepID=UPI0008DB2F49|nr:class I adenylate-forming enzyme family protein [Pseudofrankia sp. BMG5.36]OHV44606.1 hypothetical protein BCD48_25525 [Pseudofrankia sp. BMG5.36]